MLCKSDKPSIIIIIIHYLLTSEALSIHGSNQRAPLTSSQLRHVWHTVWTKLDKAYFAKYEKFESFLPLQKSWKWEGKDFPRIPAMLDFASWAVKYNFSSLDRVMKTTFEPELEFFNPKTIVLYPFQGHNHIGDLHLPINVTRIGGQFDLILLGQTFEHLYNPFLAAVNLYDALVPGGFLYANVPFINFPHMTPYHYMQFTLDGFACMLFQCGFEIVEVGQWGNQEYVQYIGKQIWADYTNLMHNGSIINQKMMPVQVWVLVRKPKGGEERRYEHGGERHEHKHLHAHTHMNTSTVLD